LKIFYIETNGALKGEIIS